MGEHCTWLVPVRVDADGTLLVCCPGLDDGYLPIDFWALWCADCSAVASEPVVGSTGVQSLEDLPYSEEVYEGLYGRIHAHWLTVTGGQPGAPVRFPAAVVARYETARHTPTRGGVQ